MKFSLILPVFGLLGAGVSQSLSSTSSVLPPIGGPTGQPSPRSSSTGTGTGTLAPGSTSVATRSALTTSVTPASLRPSASAFSSIGPVVNGTIITTTVDAFVTICVTTQTFTINGICYTATTPGQAITVTNCGCTVVATSTPSAGGLITGAIATPAQPVGPTAVSYTQPGGATAVSSAQAVGGTATQYATASATKYVTAAGANVNVAMSLLAFFISLPLFVALML